jgi:hypothetical protein
MNPFTYNIAIPEELVADFAADPLSQDDKVLLRSDDSAWPLYNLLRNFIEALPERAINWAYSDKVFLDIYGRDEQLARIWFTQHLLTEEVSRRRLGDHFI